MKTKKIFVVSFVLAIFLTGCQMTYTISSNDLLDSGERLIKTGCLSFRWTRLTIVNSSKTDLTAVIAGGVVRIPALSLVNIDIKVNILPDGSEATIPIAIMSPNGSLNPGYPQSWYIRPQGSNSVWVIQVSENQITLQRSS